MTVLTDKLRLKRKVLTPAPITDFFDTGEYGEGSTEKEDESPNYNPVLVFRSQERAKHAKQKGPGNANARGALSRMRFALGPEKQVAKHESEGKKVEKFFDKMGERPPCRLPQLTVPPTSLRNSPPRHLAPRHRGVRRTDEHRQGRPERREEESGEGAARRAPVRALAAPAAVGHVGLRVEPVAKGLGHDAAHHGGLPRDGCCTHRGQEGATTSICPSSLLVPRHPTTVPTRPTGQGH